MTAGRDAAEVRDVASNRTSAVAVAADAAADAAAAAVVHRVFVRAAVPSVNLVVVVVVRHSRAKGSMKTDDVRIQRRLLLCAAQCFPRRRVIW